MVATRVSVSAARRLGMTLSKGVALVLMLQSCRAGDVSKIYVLSNGGGSRVTTYTPDGKPSVPTIGLGRCNCNGLAVDAAGKIYVGNNWLKENVMVFQPDGTRVTPTLNLGIGAMGVAVDRSGKMFVLGNSRGNAVVKAFGPDGAGTGLAINAGFALGSYIAVDASGKIYVALKSDNLVKTFDSGGLPATPTIRAGLDTPTSVAVGPDGKIYVGNYVTVTTYKPDGQRINPTMVVEDSAGGRPTPTAVTVGSDGKIYVGYYSVWGNHGWVVVFGPDGKPVGAPIVTPWAVSGIAVR